MLRWIRLLINGDTIAQTRTKHVIYWHVKLDVHDILLAENLPAESFLDTGNRHAFENGGPALALHPDFAARVWESRSCAALCLTGGLLDDIRTRLWRRAVMPAKAAKRDRSHDPRSDPQRYHV